MHKISLAGQQTIGELAQRHGFSREAVTSMLESVASGHGTMAQFNHPEFGGSGQWMRGGMTMVSDLFNDALKGRIDKLCSELSRLVADDPDFSGGGAFQSQSQDRDQGVNDGGVHSDDSTATRQRQNADGPGGSVSLFVSAPGSGRHWWPANLGTPTSTGAQNDARYAYFAQPRRLAIEVNGRFTLYDTLDHQIGGFSQQQSRGGSLSFHSQHGLLDVGSLPVVAGDVLQQQAAPQTPTQRSSAGRGNLADPLAAIEKLGDLHARGLLSDEEFAAKKAELLGRV